MPVVKSISQWPALQVALRLLHAEAAHLALLTKDVTFGMNG